MVMSRIESAGSEKVPSLQPNMRDYSSADSILLTVFIKYHNGLSVPLALPNKDTVVCVFVVVDQVRYP